MSTLVNSTTRTQKSKIFNFLLTGSGITGKVALDHFGCFRLASRIHDLKAMGVPIQSKNIAVTTGSNKTRVAYYWIDSEDISAFRYDLASGQASKELLDLTLQTA